MRIAAEFLIECLRLEAVLSIVAEEWPEDPPESVDTYIGEEGPPTLRCPEFAAWPEMRTYVDNVVCADEYADECGPPTEACAPRADTIVDSEEIACMRAATLASPRWRR